MISRRRRRPPAEQAVHGVHQAVQVQGAGEQGRGDEQQGAGHRHWKGEAKDVVKAGQEQPQAAPDEWKEGQGPAQLPGPGGDGDREGHGGEELHRQHHRGQQLRPAGRARYTHRGGGGVGAAAPARRRRWPARAGAASPVGPTGARAQ